MAEAEINVARYSFDSFASFIADYKERLALFEADLTEKAAEADTTSFRVAVATTGIGFLVRANDTQSLLQLREEINQALGQPALH